MCCCPSLCLFSYCSLEDANPPLCFPLYQLVVSLVLYSLSFCIVKHSWGPEVHHHSSITIQAGSMRLQSEVDGLQLLVVSRIVSCAWQLLQDKNDFSSYSYSIFLPFFSYSFLF